MKRVGDRRGGGGEKLEVDEGGGEGGEGEKMGEGRGGGGGRGAQVRVKGGELGWGEVERGRNGIEDSEEAATVKRDGHMTWVNSNEVNREGGGGCGGWVRGVGGGGGGEVAAPGGRRG